MHTVTSDYKRTERDGVPTAIRV